MAGCGVVVGEVTVTSSSARSGSGCEVTSLCSRAGEIAGGEGSIGVWLYGGLGCRAEGKLIWVSDFFFLEKSS